MIVRFSEFNIQIYENNGDHQYFFVEYCFFSQDTKLFPEVMSTREARQYIDYLSWHEYARTIN